MAEEKTKQKRSFLFNPLKRPLPYIGLLIGIVLIIFQQTIRNYVSDTLGTIMVTAMKDATDGEYKITYDLVRFDVISKELRISNLLIELDTSVISKEEYLRKKPNLLNISTPILVLKLRAMFPFLIKKRLYVSYVGVKDPRFSLTRSDHVSVVKDIAQVNKQAMRDIVNNYFAALEIDSFRVVNGSFNISSHAENDREKSIIQVDKFTTMLKNFRLDSLSPSILLSGFKATRAEVELVNQRFNIPETNRYIYFNRFRLSTSDSIIELDSLVIGSSNSDNTKTESALKIAQLKIQGLNFDKAFNQNALFIDKIEIYNPQINLSKKELDALNKRNTTTFSKSMYDYLEQLQVNHIRLEHGSVNIGATQQTKVLDFSFHLSDYDVSPNDWKQKKVLSNLFIDSFEANNITQELPDSIHVANIKKVYYSEITKRIIVDNIKISPIAGRNRYKILKSRNTNYTTYTGIKNITVTNCLPEVLFRKEPLIMDSLLFDRPSISIVQYPRMQIEKSTDAKNFNFPFSIDHLVSTNGRVKLRQNQGKESKQTQLNAIYLSLLDVSEKSSITDLPKSLNLEIANGNLELKDIGHTLTFTHLSALNGNTILAELATIKPDSSTLPLNQINIQISNASLFGYQIEDFKNHTIALDSVSLGKIDAKIDLTREPFESNTEKEQHAIRKIRFSNLTLGKSVVDVKLMRTNINVNDLEISTQNIQVESLSKAAKTTFNFDNLLLNFGQYTIQNKLDTTLINGLSGKYMESDSSFIANNIQFKSASKNIDFSISELEIRGLDKIKLKNEKILSFHVASISKPNFDLITKAKPSSDVKPIVDLSKRIFTSGIKGVQFNAINITKGNAKIKFSSVNKKLEIKQIEGIISNSKIDTLTTIKDAIDQFKTNLSVHSTSLIGLNDTLEASQLSIDTDSKIIWSEAITYNAILNKNNIQIKSPGIAIQQINVLDLFKNKISIVNISSRNNFIQLTHTDSSTNKLDLIANRNSTIQDSMPMLTDIVLPFNLNINAININNTTFNYLNPYRPNGQLNNIRFDVEIDSLLLDKDKPSRMIEVVKDARFRTYAFDYKLPDSLNIISFDTLTISTASSSIGVANVKLTPRYSKSEYGRKAGFQADWKHLLIEKVKLENIDLMDLVLTNTFKCQKIIINKGLLNLYKDKQLPFPSNRVMPMEQDVIRNLKTKIKLDTVEINNIDINQITLQSSGKTEGSISFINTSGIITNVTNDSLRLVNNHKMKVNATTKIMNKGALSSNFEFDLIDSNNSFSFDANLGPMQAAEFNNILEATAFVAVTSGNIKSLSLQANGNSSYAYGNMSFIYNNLKVETINKKSLVAKGMGKVLKTFFANTFVVKKNNSKIKLLSRRGEMYYERNPARITLDYAAKTALSGVVSSIGAKTNRKEIKQIHKDNKHLKDQELKLIRVKERAAKKDAK